MKYACLQRYFENGETYANVFPVADNIKPHSKSKANFDEYLDVFDTKEEAEQYKKDTDQINVKKH